MTRDQIDRRIDNERKLRNEGYSNREIAQIMGVGYHTVINDIGKEPQDLRERRREAHRSAVDSVKGSGEVVFPGSYKPAKKEPEEPATPFAEVWQKAEETHDALIGLREPVTAQSATQPMRKPKIISDRLELARGAWSKVVNGDVCARQPEVQSATMFFDRENKPWLTIVYSEVCE